MKKSNKKIVKVLGHEVVEGSAKYLKLIAQKKHFDDLLKYETNTK